MVPSDCSKKVKKKMVNTANTATAINRSRTTGIYRDIRIISSAMKNTKASKTTKFVPLRPRTSKGNKLMSSIFSSGSLNTYKSPPTDENKIRILSRVVKGLSLPPSASDSGSTQSSRLDSSSISAVLRSEEHT